jgi:hypothetical protein
MFSHALYHLFSGTWKRVVRHCIKESTRKARPNTLPQGTKYPFISSFSAFLYTSSTVAKILKKRPFLIAALPMIVLLHAK